MARTVAALPAGSRITDYISLGVMARFFPIEKIREVLKQTNRASVRERDLPAHVVIYYVIALALYCGPPIAKFCAACWKACSGSWPPRRR
jgi:hypothetical protein